MTNRLPEEPVRFQLTLSLPPRLLLALGLAWGLVVVAFALFPIWQPVIVFAASSLGGVAGLAAAFYLARSIVTAAQHAERTEKRERLKIAFQYMERWNNPHSYHVRNASREILRIGATEGTERVRRALSDDAGLRSNVMDVMNFFEEMALAVTLDTADEGTLKQAFQAMFTMHWMTLSPFINERRAVLGKADLLIECEKLHGRWA